MTQMNTELEERIRRETNTPPEKELGGATLGIRNIMQARKIVLVAKGANKADIVRKYAASGRMRTQPSLEGKPVRYRRLCGEVTSAALPPAGSRDARRSQYVVIIYLPLPPAGSRFREV